MVLLRSLILVLVATSNFCRWTREKRDRGGWTGFSGLLPVRRAAVCSYLLCVVGEEHFVEDLGAVLLDGAQLHRMWRQLPGLHPAQRSRTPLLCHFVTETQQTTDTRMQTVPTEDCDPQLSHN